MKYTSIICSLIVITSISHQLWCFRIPKFDKISNVFKKYKAEKVIEKEYPLAKIDMLKISNTKGCIVIPSEWEQPMIRVKATIKAGKEEELANITINHSQNKNFFTLSTHAPETCTHHVDYEVIVPKKINLDLVTKVGNMTIAEVSGNVQARTHKGNIVIGHSKNNVVAETVRRGNIAIRDAHGPLQAHAKKGNITIDNARNSICAHTQSGIVRTAHDIIPHASNINLGSEYGNIIVALPSCTNADLNAKAENGCITSDHYLTLKSQTTKLDPKSWSRFKREVHATLGTGEASIQLTCKNGTIKLLDNSVTS